MYTLPLKRVGSEKSFGPGLVSGTWPAEQVVEMLDEVLVGWPEIWGVSLGYITPGLFQQTLKYLVLLVGFIDALLRCNRFIRQ
ncbi:unnamed protein product [Angiostrongylus costaricensis]|uniref:Bacteriophage protein n=1 Tax=Angiostrongylus costaricensis TaxID=334426 RepID=A0A0R3PWH7_ANGCS|nr:unnamed protein product [Angiostrongylus costaricensis]